MNQQFLEKVYGYKEVKKELKTIQDWYFNYESLGERRKMLPKGILFYGEPGEGKTHMVREYSKSFGYDPDVDDFTDRMLCGICVKQNIPIVVMLPPIDVIIQRMMDRGDDFYSVVSPNVHAIYKDYEDYCAARHFINVFRDYNPSKLVDFLLKNDLDR